MVVYKNRECVGSTVMYNRVYKIITVIIITLQVVRLIRGRGWSGRAGL